MIRRIAKILVALFAAGVVGVAAGLAWLSWQQPASVTLPAPTGPYAVGRTFFDWVDEAWADPLAPVPGVQRELTVWIWYPAIAASEPREDFMCPASTRAECIASRQMVRSL